MPFVIEEDQPAVPRETAPTAGRFVIEEDQPVPSTPAERSLGQAAAEAVTNIPSSALSAGKSIFTALRHPIQTAEATGKVALGGLHRGAEALGMEPTTKEYEPEFDAFSKMLKNRYGGWENVKNTLATDPVGFAMDISTILGGAGAVLKGSGTGEVAAEAARATDPMAIAGVAGRTAAKGISYLPTGITKPERLYGSAVKFSTTLKPEERAIRINTGLEEAILPTQSGLEKLRDTISNINKEIEDKIVSSAKKGDAVRAEEVAKRVDELKPFYENAINPAPYLQELEDLKKQFIAAHGENIPVETAQKIKQTTYALLRKQYGELKTVQVEGQKAIARGLKEELVNRYPELATLNERDSRLINLEKSIERAVNRIDNKDMVGIGTTIAGTAGYAVTGEPHVGLLTLIGKHLVDSPSIKAKLAIALNKARKKELLAGPSKTRGAFKGLFQAGRLKESMPEDELQK